MKKIELSDREKEILLLVNRHVEIGMASEKIKEGDWEAVKSTLDEAWKMPIPQLWELGIGKFQIALMYAKFFNKKEFAAHFSLKKSRERISC